MKKSHQVASHSRTTKKGLNDATVPENIGPWIVDLTTWAQPQTGVKDLML
jgi:hypothetical protein